MVTGKQPLPGPRDHCGQSANGGIQGPVTGARAMVWSNVTYSTWDFGRGGHGVLIEFALRHHFACFSGPCLFSQSVHHGLFQQFCELIDISLKKFIFGPN